MIRRVDGPELLWLMGPGATLAELADRYGFSLPRLEERAREERWIEQLKAMDLLLDPDKDEPLRSRQPAIARLVLAKAAAALVELSPPKGITVTVDAERTSLLVEVADRERRGCDP